MLLFANLANQAISATLVKSKVPRLTHFVHKGSTVPTTMVTKNLPLAPLALMVPSGEPHLFLKHAPFVLWDIIAVKVLRRHPDVPKVLIVTKVLLSLTRSRVTKEPTLSN